jgi:hypothetical protein
VQQATDWAKLADQVRAWPVDTLFFISLSGTLVGTIASNLAARGVWSAPPHRFNQTLQLTADDPSDDLYRRFVLWPSAYQASTLQQAGRYLNGARTVTPVYLESEAFRALNQRCERELGRAAGPIDAIFLDVLASFDEAMRFGKSRQVSLVDALKRYSKTPRFTRPLDFTKPQVIQELFEVEVRGPEFMLVEPPSAPADEETVSREVKPKPEQKPEQKPDPKPDPKPEQKPEQKPDPKPEQTPEPKLEQAPEPKPDP